MCSVRSRLAPLAVAGAMSGAFFVGACGGDDEQEIPSRLRAHHTKEDGEFWRQLNARQKDQVTTFCRAQAAVAAGERDPGQAADPIFSKAYQAVQRLDDEAVRARLNQFFAGERNRGDTIRSACRQITTELVAAEERRRQEARERRLAAQTCDAKGINPEEGKEGTCLDDDTGTRVRVVNRATPLKLEELTAQLVDISTAKTVTSDIATERAAGTYAIIKLAVTNRLNAPTTFDQSQDQVFLALGNKEFSQDFDAENLPGESFVWNSDEIQPGETRTGTVIFDVPNASIGELETTGNIVIFNFSDAGATYESAGATVGIIRTYR